MATLRNPTLLFCPTRQLFVVSVLNSHVYARKREITNALVWLTHAGRWVFRPISGCGSKSARDTRRILAYAITLYVHVLAYAIILVVTITGMGILVYTIILVVTIMFWLRVRAVRIQPECCEVSCSSYLPR